MYQRFFGTLLFCLFATVAWAQPDYLQQGLEEQDPNRQLDFFTKELNVRPSRPAYYFRGYTYLILNRINSGMTDLQKALSAPQHPNSQHNRVAKSDVNGLLTYCYYALGQYDKAVEYANTALAEYAKNETALRYRGLAHLELEHLDLAVQDFTNLLALNAQDVDRYFYRAQAYRQQRKYTEALTDVEKALQLDSGNRRLKEMKAILLENLGRTQESTQMLEQLAEFRQDDPNSLVNMGNIFLNNADYPKAVFYYDKAVDLYNKKIQQAPDFRTSPEGKTALYNIYLSRGGAYFSMKEYQKALADFYKAAEAKPDDHLVWYQIGNLQTDRRNFQEAVTALEKCFALNPNFSDGWINLGFSYGELHQRDNAIKTYNRALRVANIQGRGLLLNNRGFSYLEQGKLPEAKRDLEEAIAEDPEICMSHISMGEYFIEAQDYPSAIAKFDFALNMPARSDRETLVANYKRGMARYRAGDIVGAIRDLEAATRVNLDHVESSVVEAWELLGMAYFDNNQLCDAQQALKKALVLDEQTPFEDTKKSALYLQKVTARNPYPCR